MTMDTSLTAAQAAKKTAYISQPASQHSGGGGAAMLSGQGDRPFSTTPYQALVPIHPAPTLFF
jgi:hypothetical protein